MDVKRALGRSQGCRLWRDQELWLEAMEAQRSAKAHALIRAALDHYRPVYEALNQQADPELQALATEAAKIVGPDKVRAALAELIDRAVALPSGLEAGGGERGGR